MKEFLSTFMSKHRNDSDNFLHDEKIRFEKTCEMMIKHLGNRPLSKSRRTLNPSSFHMFFQIVFFHHVKEIIRIISMFAHKR